MQLFPTPTHNGKRHTFIKAGQIVFGPDTYLRYLGYLRRHLSGSAELFSSRRHLLELVMSYTRVQEHGGYTFSGNLR
jgi:hypothetical protein